MKTEAFENGFKSLLKTHRFENAPFIVWIGENRAAFENDAETSDVSISIFGVRFNSMDNRRKRVKKNPFSYENAFWAKCFSSFSLRRKGILLKTQQCGGALNLVVIFDAIVLGIVYMRLR